MNSTKEQLEILTTQISLESISKQQMDAFAKQAAQEFIKLIRKNTALQVKMMARQLLVDTHDLTSDIRNSTQAIPASLKLQLSKLYPIQSDIDRKILVIQLGASHSICNIPKQVRILVIHYTPKLSLWDSRASYTSFDSVADLIKHIDKVILRHSIS